MGYGIDELTLLDLVNHIISPGPHEDPQMVHSFVPEIMGIMNRITRTNKDISRVVEANSIDKQRANRATKETRNHHFTKAKNYGILLHQIGHSVPSANVMDWPSE
eukprot:12159811-Ditylum_brightwellii.AAC.1